MSFYDLAKDNVLSGSELFKYRFKRDTTVPSKGGQKCFEPDGSWMQAKALESFMQERSKVLGEPKVEKIKSLVQGIWEEEKRLVNLKKPGKFWAHMGFTDKRRNWLYPEEALFLMETNTMEVYHKSLPLSVQEAFEKFFGEDLSLEEYQVYAHLRRLGFVVLRQDTELAITPYEKQINLDKYMSKKAKKERKLKNLAEQKGLNLSKDTDAVKSQDSSETKSEKEHVRDLQDVESAVNEGEQNESSASNLNNISVNSLVTNSVRKQEHLDDSVDTTVTDSSKRPLPDEDEQEQLPKRLKTDTDSGETPADSTESTVHNKSLDAIDAECQRWYSGSVWEKCMTLCLSKNLGASNHEEATSSSESDTNKESLATQNTTDKSFPFPTIASISMLSLPQPQPKLLPKNVVVNEDYNDILTFNVDRYRSQHPLREESRTEQRETDREARIRNLEFSFAEWTQRKPQKIKASSWTEYKRLVRESHAIPSSSATPVDHLWKGTVTPLVRPEDATDKKSILDRLNIIQSADDTLLPNQDCMVDLKVSFSVHLPDSKFKKSLPGTPNHRVCVIKCSAEPPNLAELQEVWSGFKDGVPLHCAVVDSGEIAFYIFDNTFKLDVLL